MNTYLHVAFCYIEWGDTGVGDTTGQNTTEHALGVVRDVMGDGGVGEAIGQQLSKSAKWR